MCCNRRIPGVANYPINAISALKKKDIKEVGLLVYFESTTCRLCVQRSLVVLTFSLTLSPPSGMRILVTLLLDTLPMLGNVLLLCFFVFFIFGIVGVQLWVGRLRNRCFVEDNLPL